jgi:hypothetical protein
VGGKATQKNQGALGEQGLVQPDLMNRRQVTGRVRIHGAGRLRGTGSQKGTHLARRWADGGLSILGATQHARSPERREGVGPQPRLPSEGKAGNGNRADTRRGRPANREPAQRPELGRDRERPEPR